MPRLIQFGPAGMQLLKNQKLSESTQITKLKIGSGEGSDPMYWMIPLKIVSVFSFKSTFTADFNMLVLVQSWQMHPPHEGRVGILSLSKVWTPPSDPSIVEQPSVAT